MSYIFKYLGISFGLIAILNTLNFLIINTEAINAVAFIFNVAYRFNSIIDVDAMLVVFILVLVAEASVLGIRAFKMVLFYIK